MKLLNILLAFSIQFSAFANEADNKKAISELGEVYEMAISAKRFHQSPLNIMNELKLPNRQVASFKLMHSYYEYGYKVHEGYLLENGKKVPSSEVILVEGKYGVNGRIEVANDNFLILPQSSESSLLKSTTSHSLIHMKSNANGMDDHPILPPPPLNHATLKNAHFRNSQKVDRDPDGNIVIDLFMGFSEVALQYIQDADAYAVMQTATINKGLRNSKIEGIKVRLVGTGSTPNHQGMASEVLSKLKDWFADDIAKYSPDVVVGFMRWEEGFENQATGWGYVNGYYNINDILSANAFRHELGHNIGGVHCNDGNGYHFGYNNGMTKTHQCGNNINYYSNPEVTDMHGLVVGHESTANMARVWREQAAEHSSFRPAVVPFEGELPSVLLHQSSISVQAGNWKHFAIDIDQDVNRFVAITTSGDQTIESGVNLKLFARHQSEPTLQTHDYASFDTGNYKSTNRAIGVNSPENGRWFVSIYAEKGNVDDIELEILNYLQVGEEVETPIKDPIEGQMLQSLADSDMCFTTPEPTKLNSRIIISQCVNGANQQWAWINNQLIFAANPALCATADSSSNFSYIRMKACEDDSLNQWSWGEDKSLTLLNHSNWAIDFARSENSIIIYSHHGGTNQQWQWSSDDQNDSSDDSGDSGSGDGGSGDGSDDNTGSSDIVKASIISPQVGTVLNAEKVSFKFESVQAELFLTVGTQQGKSDLFNGSVTGTIRQEVLIPLNGEPVFVQLATLINDVWETNEYQFETEKVEVVFEEITEGSSSGGGSLNLLLLLLLSIVFSKQVTFRKLGFNR